MLHPKPKRTLPWRRRTKVVRPEHDDSQQQDRPESQLDAMYRRIDEDLQDL